MSLARLVEAANHTWKQDANTELKTEFTGEANDH